MDGKQTRMSVAESTKAMVRWSEPKRGSSRTMIVSSVMTMMAQTVRKARNSLPGRKEAGGSASGARGRIGIGAFGGRGSAREHLEGLGPADYRMSRSSSSKIRVAPAGMSCPSSWGE